MRRGHRRTQSSYINPTYQQIQECKTQQTKQQQPSHQILNILKACQDKVSTKFEKQHQPVSSRNSTCSSQQIKNIKKYGTERKDYSINQTNQGIQVGFHKFDKIQQKSNELKVDLERKFKKKQQRNIYYFKNSKIQQQFLAEQQKKKLKKTRKKVWY